MLQCNNFLYELQNASAQKLMPPLVTQKFNKLISSQQLQQTNFEVSVLSSADTQKVIPKYNSYVYYQLTAPVNMYKMVTLKCCSYLNG
jgi:hypothetical protein